MMEVPTDPNDPQVFHTTKLERAVAAYESVLVSRGQRARKATPGWDEDSSAAMSAALREFGRLSPLTPTFIVTND